MNKSPITSTSILVRKKQSSASSGRQTTGSFSLNEVFSTIGTPLSARNASISAWQKETQDPALAVSYEEAFAPD